MSLSQVVENLRHDLRQGEAVSSRPDSDAGRVFKIHLDYMMSGSLGYATPDMVKGQTLNL